VHNESHVLYSIAGRRLVSMLALSLSFSLDIVTYFPRLIDKGNYTESNIVTKVYEVAGNEKLNHIAHIERASRMFFIRNKIFEYILTSRWCCGSLCFELKKITSLVLNFN